MSKKNQVRIAKRAASYDRLRGDMISQEISKEIPYPDQVAIVMNALEYLFALLSELRGKDLRTEEWTSYQNIRAEAKAKVDKMLEENK